MDYMATVRRGWDLTWKHKFLWVLGFLGALTGGGLNYSYSSGNYGGQVPNFTPEQVAAVTAGALAFGCIAFIVGIVLWLVSLAARGGMITAVDTLDRGEESRFGLAFRQGWRKLFSLIGMTILLFAPVFILSVVLIVGFAGTLAGAIASGMSGGSEGLTTALGTASLAFICLLCILFPLFLVLSLIYPFAYRGIMLRDMRVTDAIRHGWRVLRDNLGPILVLGIIFFFLGLIISGIVFGILAVLGVGTGLIMLAATGGELTTAQWIIAGLGLLGAIIIFAAISAVLTAWRSATFTLAYNQWTGKAPLKSDIAPAMPDPSIG